MKPTADEFNIAASMEPVSVFDATSHTNSEWPEQPVPEWKDGWPPLHKDCLVSDSQGRREIVKPLAYDEQIVVYKSYSDDIYYDFSHYTNFSPILTAEQKVEQERQEVIIKIQRILSEAHSGDSLEGLRMATDLYEAGYRLKDTNND